MAITKIWTVKSRLDSSLNYIANPDKTSIKPDIDAVEGVIKYIKMRTRPKIAFMSKHITARQITHTQI